MVYYVCTRWPINHFEKLCAAPDGHKKEHQCASICFYYYRLYWHLLLKPNFPLTTFLNIR